METEEEKAARIAEEERLAAELAAGDGETVSSVGESRLDKMNRIANKADADRADEFADVNDDDTTVAFKPPKIDADGNEIDDAAATEAAAAAEEAAAAAARAAAAVDADTQADAEAVRKAKHRIKVNGVEKDLTTEELIALAQKSESADTKFQEAARLRAEAESLAAKGPPEPDVSADDSAELLALARALQVGTDEEAVAALRKLKSPAPSGVKPDELFQYVDAKIAFNEANRIFEQEFSDLVADPRLERMIFDRDKELLAGGDKRPYLVRYREIGGEVRGWLKSITPAQTPAPPPPDALADKAARKAAAPVAPPVAGGKAAPKQPDDEPEESVHETIAKIQASRGGAQWMKGLRIQ